MQSTFSGPLLGFPYVAGWDEMRFVRQPLGAVGGFNDVTGMPLCPPHIQHDLAWDRIRAAALFVS
jgi:hypothetical protein